MTLAIDLSNHQSGLNLLSYARSHPDLVAVQLKASEGQTYVDATAATFFAQAEKAGLVASFYHFARPETDRGTTGGVAEADFFLSKVWGYKDRKAFGRPVLDYETANDPVFAESFCKRVEQKLGVKPIIYCSGSRVGEIASRPYTKSCPLWVAAYGPTYKQWVPQGMNAWMWQYTDNYQGLHVDASQVFVHQDQLRVNHPKPVLIVKHDGKRHVIKPGDGRIRRFLRHRLVHLLKAGKRVTLRRRAR